MKDLLPFLETKVLSLTLSKANNKTWEEMMDDEIQMMEQGDSIADAVAAVALILIFVTTCVFWISGQ